MATNDIKINNMPHIKNVKAGVNKWDPVHKSIFEVYIDMPEGLQGIIPNEDFLILTQQVISVQGLDALQKTTAAGEQKFFGTTVSFLNPMLDTTAADLTINFNLNLREVTDNYVLKVFMAWEKLSYDILDGSRTLKAQYICDNLHIAEANRDGTVWREYRFHNVMLTGVTGLDDLDYSSNDARTLACTFRCDYWDYDVDNGESNK